MLLINLNILNPIWTLITVWNFLFNNWINYLFITKLFKKKTSFSNLIQVYKKEFGVGSMITISESKCDCEHKINWIDIIYISCKRGFRALSTRFFFFMTKWIENWGNKERKRRKQLRRGVDLMNKRNRERERERGWKAVKRLMSSLNKANYSLSIQLNRNMITTELMSKSQNRITSMYIKVFNAHL